MVFGLTLKLSKLMLQTKQNMKLFHPTRSRPFFVGRWGKLKVSPGGLFKFLFYTLFFSFRYSTWPTLRIFGLFSFMLYLLLLSDSITSSKFLCLSIFLFQAVSIFYPQRLTNGTCWKVLWISGVSVTVLVCRNCTKVN